MTTRRQTEIATTRARQRRKAKRPRRRWPWLVAAFVLLTGVTVLAGLVGTIFALSRNLPRLETSERKRFAQDTIIYDRYGKQIAVLYGAASRQIVTSKRIPQVMKDATVAIEDRRFYEHHGVDFMGIARAGVADLRAGKVVQGGSTLTAQFVKQAYVGSEQTLQRKIREAVLAWELEDKWSKDKILTEYLNTVFYGENSSGVQAASLRYFHKPVWKVTLAEAAMLAALPRAPSDNNPIVNPKVARVQRNIVIDLMEEQGYATAQAADRARKAPLGVFSEAPPTERGLAAYFVDYVKQQLINRYGARMVYDGGLRVYTSIDMRMQEKATQALKGTLPPGPDGALCAVEPTTGYIRAMTATTDWKNTKYSVAWQGGRQPGSAMKVFALTAVVEAGANPATTFYVSHPLHIPTPGAPEPFWDVHTYDHSSAGKINLVQATLASDNTVFAQLALDLGAEKIVKTAHKMGITSPLGLNPSIVLGGLSNGVNTLEMSVAYATLASGGIYHKPLAIEKVVFPGGRVDKTQVKGKRVLSEGVAYVVDKILQQNTVSGTASAMPNFYKGISAGKTGTTDNSTDAWFCGFNPRLSTSVWMGYFKENLSMDGVAGATYCVPVWGKFYNAVFGTQVIPDFVRPDIMPTWKKWKGKYSKASPSPKKSSKKPSPSPTGSSKPTPTPTKTSPKPSPTPTKTSASPTPTTTTTAKPIQGLLEALVQEASNDSASTSGLLQRMIFSLRAGPLLVARL